MVLKMFRRDLLFYRKTRNRLKNQHCSSPMVMDVAPLLPQDAQIEVKNGKYSRNVTRGRGRRCVLVASVLAAATLIYFCAVTLPLATDADYHPTIAGYESSLEATEKSSALREDEKNVTKITEKLNKDNVVITNVNFSDANHAGFVLNTPGCKIPDIPARNPLIFKYIKDLEPKPKCEESWAPLSGKNKQRGPPLVQSNLTSMWVIQSALEKYNITDIKSISCCYRPFWRIKENAISYGFKADGHYKYSKQCIPFNGYSTNIDAEDHEYVRVECSKTYADIRENSTDSSSSSVEISASSTTKKTPREIYRDFHAFIPIKRHVEERCMKSPHKADEVSVVMLGIDAVSRLNMLRELPLLHSVLTSPPLSAISLLGYNKVGDNTFPNVMPILTGLAEDELKDVCPWPSAKHKLDPCPFIWKDFANRGYRTACGEDATWMSSFNYAKTGFVNVPTDYYSRPYLQAAENEQGHFKRWNVKLCVGPRLALSNILEYVRKYSLRFSNERHFGFFWTNSVSHDFLNMPHNGDVLYSELIHELSMSGALDRTVLIVLSDHGIRWGGIRETYQGRMEERLPFAYISFPTWFHQRFPAAVANVRRNAKNRLTTPFDIHETLRDLLDPAFHLEPEILKSRINESLLVNLDLKQKNNSTRRGISLFLPIPVSRTCKTASIPPHFCTCQESLPVPIDDPIAEHVVQFVINEMNSWLKQYRQCAQLKLNDIRNAQRNIPLEDVRTENTLIIDYIVTFSTNPGGGVFEATVRETPFTHSTGNTTVTFSLAGVVSRINRYGDQSRCVTDFHMKLYCFCT